MAFTHRLATLAAVVAIPLGIAATSYALTDAPRAPEVPPKVELTGGPQKPGGPSPSAPAASPSGTPTGTPSGDSVVPGPSARGDDDDDDRDERPERGGAPASGDDAN
ncbi:small hydrophilic protein [Streptomyces sp. NPDC051561]|uniref:small hydrophilic protein n=1 Tax=Streptomyces sp. NPDC051561 TaxID=3365658 RepID=UPI0037A905AB